MLISTALVLLMTPALAFFYGGLVRSKNALNTMMMSFISLGFVGVLWAVVGYSLAFAPGNNWIGDLSRLFLRGVGLGAAGHDSPLPLHVLPGHVRIITAALISGAIVERMRFSAYVVFISLWALVVYAPIAHWVWGGGWLAKMGALDFAGGTVVHVNAGVAALVAAHRRRQAPRLSRRRRSCRTTCRSRCSAPACSGSAGSASTPAARSPPGNSAALAFTTTMLAPMGTLVVWTLLDYVASAASRPRSAPPRPSSSDSSRSRRPPGFIGPMSAIALGAIAAVRATSALIMPRQDRSSTIRSTSWPRTASAARSARC